MWKTAANLFFPEFCAGCNEALTTGEKVICTYCRHHLPMTNHHELDKNELWQKFYGRLDIQFVGAQFYFHKKGIVQQLIHNLKYRGNQDIGEAIGDWYGSLLRNHSALQDLDEIIPTPLHRRRLRERGYNQVTTFGKSLSQKLKISYNDSLLYRSQYSSSQTFKNLLERSMSTKPMFYVQNPEKHSNKHFLLIDDVITTGATLEACGRALMQIENAKLSIVCMAMSH